MKLEKVVLTVGFFSSVLAAVWAISSGSLWTDEFGTWLLTQADSIPDWWGRLQTWPDSDSQVPLYHFYTYEWTKAFGTDAVAMRASNVGLMVIANLALLWPFRARPNVAVPVILTSCLNACTWYYLNEIRPYIMLYMSSCLMVGASIEILGSRQSPSHLAIATLCIGAVIATGATVIGIAWAGSVFLFVVVYWLVIKERRLSQIIGKNYLAPVLAAICITVLIVHDIEMFIVGKLPAPGDNSIFTLLFSFYANFGLLGVGPGMLDLRANSVGALVPFIPIIACSSIVLGLVAIGGLLEIRTRLGIRTLSLLIVCIFLPILFIIALGGAVHWRVLPRHFIPLVSLLSLLYAFGLTWWWRKRLIGRAVPLIAVVIMGYSSLSVRYAPRHAKDDYKHAAELAAIELRQGGRVWWVADPHGALYYGIPVNDERDSPVATHVAGVQYVSRTSSSVLSAQPPPSLILLSKPDAWDRQNVVSNYLSVNEYHMVESFPAFTAWRR